MASERQSVLAIVGPTGAGKSDVAFELAKNFDGEIVSADSMQVYIGMDIGTDKPNRAALREVRHHLIDVVGFGEDYSAAQYQRMSRNAIDDIGKRDKLPILAGGSGLYVRAAVDPLEFPAGEFLSPYRRQLEERALNDPRGIWNDLNSLDPEAADRIPPRNVRRVIRALEVIKETGDLFSNKQMRWTERRSIYNTFFIGLSLERDELYTKIESRVDRMMNDGFLNEVEGLIRQGLALSTTARQALGYKELIDYLEDKATLDEMVAKIKLRTRQFAKRQLTWFGADPRIHWISMKDKDARRAADEIQSLVTKE